MWTLSAVLSPVRRRSASSLAKQSHTTLMKKTTPWQALVWVFYEARTQCDTTKEGLICVLSSVSSRSAREMQDVAVSISRGFSNGFRY